MRKQFTFLTLLLALCIGGGTLKAQTGLNCTFENDSDTAGWVLVNGTQTNKWAIGSATANSGTKSLYISNTSGTSHNYIHTASLVYAYKEMALNAGGHAVAFDWKAWGESNYDYLRVFLVPSTDTTPIVAGQTPLGGTGTSSFATVAPPTGWIDLANGKLNLDSTWNNFYLEFAVPAAGNYKLLFFWANDGSGGYNPPAAIDNIVLNQPTCPAPDNLLVTAVTDEGFTFSWSENGTATQWLVRFTDNGNTTMQLVTDTFCTFTNLAPNGSFDLSVAALCGVGDTSAWRSLYEVRTANCVRVTSLPYNYGFEDATGSGTSHSINSCWTKATSYSTTAYPYPSGTQKRTGDYALYFYSASTPHYSYAVTPMFYDPINTLQANFYLLKTSANYGHLTVGVMENPNDLSTFTPLATVQPEEANEWEFFEVPFSSYTGTGHFIAFMCDQPALNYAYLDDITIDYLPTCPRPTDFVFADTTTTSIELSWTESGSATSWLLEYGPKGFEPGQGTFEEANTNSGYTLNNLNPSTIYDIYVRALCYDGDTSTMLKGSFATLCGELQLPALFNFESDVAGSTTNGRPMPYCWYRINDASGAATYWPYVSSTTTNAHSGTKTLYFYQSTTASQAEHQYAILPPVNTDDFPMASNELVFWAKMSSTYTGELIVGVMTDPTADSTFVAVDTVEIATGNYNVYTVNFANYTGDGQYIALLGRRLTGRSPYTYVDDIEVRVASACPTVENPVTISTAANEATLSWDANVMHSSYDIYYGTTGFMADTVAPGTVSDTIITLYNLLPDTEYEYYIVADCANEGLANATARYTFRTECVPVESDSLPYIEDFEAYGTGSTSPISSCWVKGTNNSTAYPYPYSTAAINGSRGLYFYSNASNYSYAVLPTFEDDVNTLRLRFNAKRHSSSGYKSTLMVGVLTSTGDLSTFDTIDIVDLTNEVINSVHAIEILFDQYSGEGGRIALYAPNGTGTNYISIDDVVVDLIPNCRRSLDLAASNITTDGATLSWSNASAVVSGYTVALSSVADFNPDTCTNLHTATTTSLTLTSLNAYSPYYWAVKANCGSEGEGEWSAIATFHTSFDCGPGKTNILGTIGEGITNSANCSFYASTIYPKAFSSHIYTTEELNGLGIQTNNTIHSIFIRCASYGDTIPGAAVYITETDMDEFSNAADTVHRDSMTLVYSGNLVAVSGEWMEIVFNTPFAYSGTRNLLVTLARTGGACPSATNFYYTSSSPDYKMVYNYTSSSGYQYCYKSTSRVNMRFNICTEVPECARPEELTADLVLSDSAFISWTGIATQYEIAYGTPGFNPDTTDATLAGTHITVNSNSYALSGLTTSTEYQLYVRANCGSEFSPWSMPISFTTVCSPAALPYSEDFESYGTGSSSNIDACWKKGTNSITNYPYPYATNAITGERSLYFYSYQPSSNTSTPYYSYAALPLLDASLDTLTLTFKVRRYSTTTASYTTLLHVGVMSDPNDISTFVAVDTIDLKEAEALSVHGIEATFENYQGNGRYIALYAPVPPLYGTATTAYNYAYVDDVHVDYTSNCPSPINITIDTTTESTAVVSWTNRASNPAGYELQYGFSGFELGTGTIVSSTTNPVTLTGLIPGKDYDVYVRTLCSTTEGGPWSIAYATFSTLCAPITTLPVTYDFENETAGSSQPLPNCWNRINDASGSFNYYPYIYNSSSYAHSGTKLLYFYAATSSSYADNSLAALPEIDTTLYPINTLEMVFWGRGGSSSTGDHSIIVGMMTDPTNLSTFTAVDTLTLTTTVSEYTVALNNYTGYGSYPAFLKAKGSASGYAYIDDITIDVMSACGRPDSLVAISSTANSATLGWRDTIGATSWTIEYGPIGGTMTTVTATGNPFTLTGLTPATNYTFRVASYCANGEMGGYSRTYCNFATSQVAATLPYTYTFEDAAEWSNWQTISNRSINWYRGTAVAGDGSYSMYISADSGATRSTNLNLVVNACAYRDIDFGTTPGSFSLTFKANVGGDTTANYDGVSVMLVDPATYVEPSDGNLTSPWGHVNNLGLGTVRHSNGWESYTYYFDNLSGVKRVVFYWFNRSTGVEDFVGDPAAIDSIAVAVQPCPRPYEVEVDTTTTTTASLSWAGNANDNYEVTYRVYGADPSTNTTVSATGTSVTLTGLSSQTEYVSWVRHLCSSTLTSDYSDPVFFTTECSYYVAADTFYEDFHTTDGVGYNEAGVLPLCWQGYSNGTNDTYLPHVVNNGTYWYTASDTRSLLLTSGSATYGDTKIVRLPQFAEPVNTLTLSYWMATESNTIGTLSVGYLTGDDFANDFVSVKDIPASVATMHSGTGYQPTAGLYDTVTFDSVPAEALYIAFKWVHGSSFYSVAIDNVKVYSDVSCPTPTVTSITHDYANATLTWSGIAANYEVSVKAQADANWPAETTVNTNSYTATGLTPATTYQYRLRALCEGGLTSSWAEGTFTTDSLPCVVPTNLAAAPAIGSAELSWTAGGEETAWNIHVWNTAFDQSFTTTTNPFTVTGLTPGVTYQVAVQAVCGGGVLMSEFSDTTSFTTDVCDPVSNVQVSNITASYAVVTWTAGENNSGNFVVEYGYEGFASGTGIGGYHTVTTNSYTITGLDEETTYEVYVRAVCDNQYNSGWSNSTSFTTTMADANVCDPVTNVTASNVTTSGATITWTPGANNSGNFEVKYGISGFNVANEGTSLTATTPSINLSALQDGTAYDVYVRAICNDQNQSIWSSVITFTTISDVCDPVTNVAVSNISATGASISWVPGTNNTDNFEVEYGPAGFNHGSGTIVTANGNGTTLFDLTAETSYDVYVRAICNGQNYSDWSTVATFRTLAAGTGDTTIVCDPVTNVTASDMTNTTATISWTPGENNNGSFVVEYGLRGFNHVNGTTKNATEPRIELSDLTKNTEYDVYVRAICDGGYSDWSAVYTFRTDNIGINTADGNNAVVIYPNPADNSTTISVSGVEGDVTVTIVDMNGRTVSTATMECAGDCEKMMNVDNLAAGSYFVRLQGNGLNTVKKLIIK